MDEDNDHPFVQNLLKCPVNENDADEFSDFMAKVDKIGSIIREMSSPDMQVSSQGLAKADEYLKYLKDVKQKAMHEGKESKIKYSRTVLNKSILNEESKTEVGSTMSAEEFMAFAERDAAERMKRKQLSGNT